MSETLERAVEVNTHFAHNQITGLLPGRVEMN